MFESYLHRLGVQPGPNYRVIFLWTCALSRLHPGDLRIPSNRIPSTIQALIHKITGMASNPYPMVAISMAVDRKQKKINPTIK